MKCPHCSYQYGIDWDDDELLSVEGEQGKFWKLAIQMEREQGWGPTEKTSLYACPGCSKTFIEND